MVKPWREIAVPHEDVLKGTFQQSEFAADLSRIRAGNATPEYQDPVLFFQRTFITEGMRLLLDSVVKRLAGKAGIRSFSCRRRSAAARRHHAGGLSPGVRQGRPKGAAGRSAPSRPRPRWPGRRTRTSWCSMATSCRRTCRRYGMACRCEQSGELAGSLVARAAYEQVRGADESCTSPGKDVLEQLLKQYAPVAILVDELVRYVAQFEEGKSLAGGTFDRQPVLCASAY